MPLNSAMFWKVRAMPWRRHVGLHLALRSAAEDDLALPAAVIDAVDHVEHRALAGAVGADDGADLVLADVEGNVGQRLDAAEAQRDVLQVEDDLADLAGGRGIMSVGPFLLFFAGCGAKVFGIADAQIGRHLAGAGRPRT
jgi:hypothetical protein